MMELNNEKRTKQLPTFVETRSTDTTECQSDRPYFQARKAASCSEPGRKEIEQEKQVSAEEARRLKCALAEKAQNNITLTARIAELKGVNHILTKRQSESL